VGLTREIKAVCAPHMSNGNPRREPPAEFTMVRGVKVTLDGIISPTRCSACGPPVNSSTSASNRMSAAITTPLRFLPDEIVAAAAVSPATLRPQSQQVLSMLVRAVFSALVTDSAHTYFTRVQALA